MHWLWDQKVKGQGHTATKFAAVVGMHVDMTASVSSCGLQLGRTISSGQVQLSRSALQGASGRTVTPLECRYETEENTDQCNYSLLLLDRNPHWIHTTKDVKYTVFDVKPTVNYSIFIPCLFTLANNFIFLGEAVGADLWLGGVPICSPLKMSLTCRELIFTWVITEKLHLKIKDCIYSYSSCTIF